MKVTLDDEERGAAARQREGRRALLPAGTRTRNFVDCCEYVPGAVAWHLASSEAVTLRNPDSKVWCPNLLKKGVCATLGPVAEPYTVGFPKPAEFFGFLATGEYTLVECYARTVLMCSWMTVLVGDPLYNPFKKNPKLKVDDVVPSPKGGEEAAAPNRTGAPALSSFTSCRTPASAAARSFAAASSCFTSSTADDHAIGDLLQFAGVLRLAHAEANAQRKIGHRAEPREQFAKPRRAVARVRR